MSEPGGIMPTPPVATLREVREMVGCTQTQLSAKWGKSQPQVVRVEQATIRTIKIGTITDYIEALGGTLQIKITVKGTTFDLE